jgi:outer membrane receptor protein involved in Fe transport
MLMVQKTVADATQKYAFVNSLGVPMFKKFRLLCLASLVTVLSPYCATVFAQSASGTLEGTISDPSGAVIAGARIHIASATTGVARDITSNNGGLYSAPDLTAGRYDVTVSANGFATKAEKGVILSVGGTRDLNITLTISSTEVTVNVESSSNQISLGDTSVQGVVDGKQTRDLPLNGRDWTSLATLNPGVSQVLTQYPGAATATTRLSRGLGAQLTIGGNRPQQNSYRLDGVNINDYANGGPGSVSGVTLGVDAVQEFSVITADAPAEYGRMSGGVINSITRQGTSAFHGSVYDFIRNSVFDSRSYFDPLTGEPSFRRNQFGGTFGGPIIKDKTFFFVNYEGFRQAQGVSSQSTVLSPNARNGIVTCTQAAAGKTQNAACDTTPGGATPAPAGTAGYQQLAVNAKVPPYLALFPLPNGLVSGNTGIYSFNSATVNNEDQTVLHLDHNFSQNDSFHGTMLYDTASLDAADGTDTLYDEAISRRTTISLEEIHLFTPRLSNSFRLGYNRSVAIAPNEKAVLNPGINNPGLAYYPGRSVGQLLISGVTTVQGGSGAVGTNGYHYNSYQLYDDATYSLGKHTITFGGNIEREQNNSYGGVLPDGEWSFGSVNAFLTNAPTFFEGALPGTPVVPHDLRQTLYAAYVQDSWKLRNNLTANLGLRYEMVTNTTETAGRLGSLPTTTSPAAVPVKSFYTNNPTTKNFEPRIGVSWDPYHNGKTIINAASGLYDNLPLNYTFIIQILGSAPSYDEGRVTTVAAGSFPTNPFAGITPPLRSIYIPSTAPRSYVIQNSISVQQQLTTNTVFTIGYIGSHGVHMLFTSNDINNVAPIGKDSSGNYYWPDTTKVTGAARAALTLNPAVGTESDSFFGGSSIYHSLQTSLSYNSPRGFVGKVAYTWSHSIDDSSSALSGASYSNSNSGLPAFDLTLDRADSDFDLRNVFSANAVAPLPNIKQGGKFLEVLRHWSLNNIFNIRSGIPMTPIVGGDPLGELGTATLQFPDRVNQSVKCTNGHTISYINTACFAFPGTVPYGAGFNGPRFGTSRRNTLDGPGLFFWTTGVMKDQAITERVRLQFQAQAFNVSNHTNFANPASAQLQIFSATGALSGTAGQLTTAATTGRQLQFALKVLF